ncbi:methyltransferase domain-containing protein [Metabacillus sp. GX 13764]|uniref:methyltransferase domain-containing protein n=1 Tax=Metabacillus kandeliae TaxID=2900151 RepID=UPI001E60C3FD|nr:methyltransferase domain-containing protein [Metabacillus kandeliae]MCD7033566.1 methyltransferase domain-containing protein [Metabacillus kandeliae]
MSQDYFIDPPKEDIKEQWQYYFDIMDIPEGAVVLDAGCNTGEADVYLARLRPDLRIIAIDSSAETIKQANQRWNNEGVEFQRADAENLPYEDGFFDAVFCVEVLEWVENPLTAIKEIKRVLKTGSKAFINHSDYETQIFSSENTQLNRKITQFFSDDGPNGIIGRELYGLCREAGFQEVIPFVYPMVNLQFTEYTYSYGMADMMAGMLEEKGKITKKEGEEWKKGLVEAHKKGRYFYSINRYICHCMK